jgi:AraC-like DNA-binding protein
MEETQFMDYPVSSSSPHAGDAVVVWANHFQFAPGEVITNRHVESRSLILGRAGTGSVESDGRTVDLTPSTWVFLPWQHTVTYRADRHDPFMASTIHLIPWHDPAVPVQLHAAHGRGDRLAGAAYRRDVDWPDLRGTIERAAGAADRLVSIANLTVDHVQHGRPDTASLRALAVLLVNELRAALTRPAATVADVPPRLARMQEYITSHLRRPLTIGEVAAAGGISESTAERLFRLHTGRAVGQWLTAKRMSAARDLLRTTNSSVSQAARAVGFDDPSYFSRLFRRTHGVPPSTYTARSRLT